MKALRMILFAALVFGFSFSTASCKSLPEKPQELSSASSSYTKICDVRKTPDSFVGDVIRLHATYKSDHLYYSYLSDESCDSKKTVDVAHPIRTHGDESVAAFFKDEDQRCKGSTVCPVRVEMDVEVHILSRPMDR